MTVSMSNASLSGMTSGGSSCNLMAIDGGGGDAGGGGSSSGGGSSYNSAYSRGTAGLSPQASASRQTTAAMPGGVGLGQAHPASSAAATAGGGGGGGAFDDETVTGGGDCSSSSRGSPLAGGGAGVTDGSPRLGGGGGSYPAQPNPFSGLAAGAGGTGRRAGGSGVGQPLALMGGGQQAQLPIKVGGRGRGEGAARRGGAPCVSECPNPLVQCATFAGAPKITRFLHFSSASTAYSAGRAEGVCAAQGGGQGLVREGDAGEIIAHPHKYTSVRAYRPWVDWDVRPTTHVASLSPSPACFFQVRKKDTGRIYAMKVLQKANIIKRNQVRVRAASELVRDSRRPAAAAFNDSHQTRRASSCCCCCCCCRWSTRARSATC